MELGLVTGHFSNFAAGSPSEILPQQRKQQCENDQENVALQLAIVLS